MRGGVRHSTSDARRTETAALTRERDDELFAARPAAQVNQASLEQPAREVLLELAHHELRQSARLLRSLEERRPVRAHHAVQHGVLGTPPRIAVGASSGSKSGTSSGNGGHAGSSAHRRRERLRVCPRLRTTSAAQRVSRHRLHQRRSGDERSTRGVPGGNFSRLQKSALGRETRGAIDWSRIRTVTSSDGRGRHLVAAATGRSRRFDFARRLRQPLSVRCTSLAQDRLPR